VRILPHEPPASLATIETRWSVVRRLDATSDPRWEDAWKHLSSTYRPAMEAYVRGLLRRTTGSTDPDEAADVVQGFLAACTEKGWLSRADPARGPFRAFVQVVLRRYLYGRLDADHARKRRAESGPPLPIDDVSGGVAGSTDDDPAALEALHQGWVEIAVARALDRLRRGNARYHQVVLDLIAHDGESSPGLAEQLGVEARHLDVLRHRSRRRFALLFEEELRATVADEKDFAEEWRALSRYLP
jgi:hypothetical protein